MHCVQQCYHVCIYVREHWCPTSSTEVTKCFTWKIESVQSRGDLLFVKHGWINLCLDTIHVHTLPILLLMCRLYWWFCKPLKMGYCVGAQIPYVLCCFSARWIVSSNEHIVLDFSHRWGFQWTLHFNWCFFFCVFCEGLHKKLLLNRVKIYYLSAFGVSSPKTFQ